MLYIKTTWVEYGWNMGGVLIMFPSIFLTLSPLIRFLEGGGGQFFQHIIISNIVFTV